MVHFLCANRYNLTMVFSGDKCRPIDKNKNHTYYRPALAQPKKSNSPPIKINFNFSIIMSLIILAIT